MRKVVVGTDGSEGAALATRWAVEEAAVHGAGIELLLVWSMLDQFHPGSDAFDPEYDDDQAKAALSTWATDVLDEGARVEQSVVCDLPARALVQAGETADLLVVGARGLGGFEGLLLGSVSARVAQLASNPVAVVRADAPVRGGRVVVGIDGSARSFQALRWAASEARARDAALDVVHAWRVPTVAVSPAIAGWSGLSSLEAAGRTVLDEALADPALAGVRTHVHLTHDRPVAALLGCAADAGLIVVGTRGRSRLVGALLGSVTRQLLHHASCPVVVI